MAERIKGISTHVLDSSRGAPASGIHVTLEIQQESVSAIISTSATDSNGRCTDLLGSHPLIAATYRLTFETAAYFESQNIAFLYPEVIVEFVVRDADSHYHIPLLLGPNTYTTYRGS
jgi:5-hydroxyisourate hydrolase